MITNVTIIKRGFWLWKTYVVSVSNATGGVIHYEYSYPDIAYDSALGFVKGDYNKITNNTGESLPVY